MTRFSDVRSASSSTRVTIVGFRDRSWFKKTFRRDKEDGDDGVRVSSGM